MGTVAGAFLVAALAPLGDAARGGAPHAETAMKQAVFAAPAPNARSNRRSETRASARFSIVSAGTLSVGGGVAKGD
jgi:hypothetical protein